MYHESFELQDLEVDQMLKSEGLLDFPFINNGPDYAIQNGIRQHSPLGSYEHVPYDTSEDVDNFSADGWDVQNITENMTLPTSKKKCKYSKSAKRDRTNSKKKRRKIILQTLKAQVADLQRKLEPLLDSKVLDANNTELHSFRVENLLSFFKFQSSNSSFTYEDWKRIACENMKVTQPTLVTLFNEANENFSCSSGLNSSSGLIDVINNASHVSSFISKVFTTYTQDGSSFSSFPEVIFHVDVDDIVAVGDTLMCKWTMEVDLNCQNSLERQELYITGMAKCCFGFCDLRLLSVDLRYDMLGLLCQLKSALGGH